MYAKATRVRNWQEYNKSLVKRGEVTLWIEESAFIEPEKVKGRGCTCRYSDKLIEVGLLLKQRYGLDFRGLTGFMSSLFRLMDLTQSVPHYTTLCRRQRGLSVPLLKGGWPTATGPITLVVDSTGLKVYGEGEWCVKKQGKAYQRSWRKVHLGIELGSLSIRACELTTSRAQDSQSLPRLLSKVAAPIERVIGDGAYDTFSCYEQVQRLGAKAIFPPRRDAKPSHQTRYHRKAAGKQAIEARDNTIRQVNALGRTAWKQQAGYHQRSLAENAMYRLKQLLGERLTAKKFEYQQLELNIRCHILNKMRAMALNGC